MDNNSAKKILSLFQDENGFLVQLRLNMSFNVAQYEEIRDTFLCYIDDLGDKPTINRQVARFLYDILTALEGSIHEFELRGHTDLQKIKHAHAEMLEITYKLLP